MPAAPETADLPERWSAQRKGELVLRLLRGEAVDAVSRKSQVPAPQLEAWRGVFRVSSEQDGWCWFFGAIDHYCDDVVGWHGAKLGDRWAALESLRQGARDFFGAVRKDAGRGVKIRCDWGPQDIADAWIAEGRWLGMTSTPSDVGEPECNGVMERFIRTLKEQCLSLHRFQTLEEARRIIAEFIARCTTEWLIARRGHRPPAEARATAERRAA